MAGQEPLPSTIELYAGLSAYTWPRRDARFCHQLVLDAYTAQHADDQTKPITTTFALLGLCLACERGLSGRAVQRAHQARAQGVQEWPHLRLPSGVGPLAVATVLDATPGAVRDARPAEVGRERLCGMAT